MDKIHYNKENLNIQGQKAQDFAKNGFGYSSFGSIKRMNSELLKAKTDIARYDTDSRITLHYTDQESEITSSLNKMDDYGDKLKKYHQHFFDQLDTALLDPIEEAINSIGEIDANTYKAPNNMGVKYEGNSYDYQTGQSYEYSYTPKDIGLQDILSNSGGFNSILDAQFQELKEAGTLVDSEGNPTIVSTEEYIEVFATSGSFDYVTTLEDYQNNVEFIETMVQLSLTVVATILCFTPLAPLGFVMNGALLAYDVTSAVTGNNLASGRQLSTTERVVTGAFAAFDALDVAGDAYKMYKAGSKILGSGGTLKKAISGGSDAIRSEVPSVVKKVLKKSDISGATDARKLAKVC